MSLGSTTANALVKHVHNIEDWPVPSGSYFQFSGVNAAASWDAITDEGAGSYRTQNNGPVVFSSVTSPGIPGVLLRADVGGVDTAIAGWNLSVPGLAVGDTVEVGDGKILIRIVATQGLYSLARSMLEHILGIGACDQPDSLNAALASAITSLGLGTYTEFARAGYSRQAVDSSWTPNITLGNYIAAKNTGAPITFGPAGENWPAGEPSTMLLVDSAGLSWWPIGSNANPVGNGFSLIFDSNSSGMGVEAA